LAFIQSCTSGLLCTNTRTLSALRATLSCCDVGNQTAWHHIPGTLTSRPGDIGTTSLGHGHNLVEPICSNKLWHHILDRPPSPSGWACKQLLKSNSQSAPCQLTSQKATCLTCQQSKGNMSHLPAVKRQYVSPASSQKALRLLLGVCSCQGTLGLPL